ncbi:MAG: hypothetical protein AB1564_04755 [Chloroflexota bacterium]
MRKSQLLVRLQNERENWEHALNYVGAHRLGIGGVSGHWSARDILAHIMVREHYLADRLREIQRGEVLPPCKTQDELDTFLEEFGYPDFESPLLSEYEANEWAIRKYRGTPFKELVALEIHAFDAVYDAVRELSEEQLNENKLFARVARYTIEHYRHHAANIRRRFKSPVKR